MWPGAEFLGSWCSLSGIWQGGCGRLGRFFPPERALWPRLPPWCPCPPSLAGNAVAALFPAGDPGEAGSLLTDRRQEDAARRALDAVRRALEALETGMTPDAVLTDAEEALDALGELTGRTAKEEIVSRIFSRFCVGK